MEALRSGREAHLYSREAWGDIAGAVAAAATGDDPVTELARKRDRLRHAGRPSTSRVVSRTVLIKGLEYDHVVIADVERIADRCNLYVALSRARKSVTIIGSTPQLTLKATPRGPREGPQPR